MAGGGRQAAGGVGTPGRIPRSSPGARVGMRGVLGVAAGAEADIRGRARPGAFKRFPRTRRGRPADGADRRTGCALRRQKETAFATPLPVPLRTRGLRRANAAEEI